MARVMRPTPSVLWHYTCADHGAPGIDRTGELRPNRHPLLPELGPVVWLTDLTDPTIYRSSAFGNVDPLGMSGHAHPRGL
jgi:hypothetical protein